MDQLTLHWGPSTLARVGSGPRATEKLLLEDLDDLIEEHGLSLLKRPLYLILPSRSRRLHLQRRILRHRKRGVAGVIFQTHHGLAAQLVQKAGLTGDSGTDLLGLFARRFAAEEPALSRSLDHLSDGYRAVLVAVRDLLDAGLDPAHHDALEEALSAEGFAVASKAEVGRAHAVVRVAVRTALTMHDMGLERSSTLLAQAARIVRDGEAGPASAVLVYGYGDATGLTIDFLQALLEVLGGRIYLDRPPDPADPSKVDAGVLFSRHFTERLMMSIPTGLPEAASCGQGSVQMFKALGGEAEVREVGSRIRGLLDSGIDPESIGVVARNLTPYREAVRTQFSRLGLPFSGVGAQAPRPPAAYRSSAILDLMRLHRRAPVERWLEASSPETLPARPFDIRLAFHTLGAGRLEEASSVRPEEVAAEGSLTLPAGLSLTTQPFEDETRPVRRFVRKRRLSREALEAEVSRARSVGEHLRPRAASRPAESHLTGLRHLLTAELGWHRDEQTSALIESAEDTVRALPSDFALGDDEFLDLLAAAWERVHVLPLGGDGGGVQILDVTEARSRTFDHLFVLGLNRGHFPRPVHEDPVLPDGLRGAFP